MRARPFAPSTAIVHLVDPGIRAYVAANDATDAIVVRLVRPDSTFPYAVALTSAALTPAAKSPFRPSERIAGIGAVHAERRRPGAWVRPHPDARLQLPAIPPGNFKTITVTKSTVTAMTQGVIANRLPASRGLLRPLLSAQSLRSSPTFNNEGAIRRSASGRGAA